MWFIIDIERRIVAPNIMMLLRRDVDDCISTRGFYTRILYYSGFNWIWMGSRLNAIRGVITRAYNKAAVE